MVSLSNHEAVPHHHRATPSWFDKLTMKATWTIIPYVDRTSFPGSSPVCWSLRNVSVPDTKMWR